MYLMTSTRCGISAKQLERELGVTYKTAWRVANLIRQELMVQDDDPLSGEVEVDETYVGGRRCGTKRGRPSEDSHKTPVLGMVERSGEVTAVTVQNARVGNAPGVDGMKLGASRARQVRSHLGRKLRVPRSIRG
jgi:transposase